MVGTLNPAMTEHQQNYKKFVFVAVETFQPIFGWAFFTTGLISLSSILALYHQYWPFIINIGRCDVTSIIYTRMHREGAGVCVMTTGTLPDAGQILNSLINSIYCIAG
ncbi:MAG: hypothetical protein ACR5LF_09480 [Symbiopectobacterium sp.]